MSDFAVRVEGLGKRYRKGAEPSGRLLEWLRRGGRRDDFWALRDVTFEVKRGGMFALVGRNGAGKSTLLRILSRITRPNEGRAEVRGRVGSLLEVGTGFHPEMTGRENVFLNGALIGMPRAEIRRKFDEIVDFSGVEAFIDTPLKRYSSGMKVRLGFAVAANLQQEILLVDEVLAVGDAAFREKCAAKMEEITRQDRTVIFVGHNLGMVGSICDRAVWLEDGRVRDEGEARSIVEIYEEETTRPREEESGFIPLPHREDHAGDGRLRFTHVRLLDGGGNQVPRFESGQHAKLGIGYSAENEAPESGVSVTVTLMGRGQTTIATCGNTCAGDDLGRLARSGEFVCEFEKLPLTPGRYKLALNCSVGGRRVGNVPNAGEFRVTEGRFYPTGLLPQRGSGAALFEYRWSHRPLPGPDGGAGD
jgi:lipopolysaccharide transport system ATP-binding protein